MRNETTLMTWDAYQAFKLEKLQNENIRLATRIKQEKSFIAQDELNASLKQRTKFTSPIIKSLAYQRRQWQWAYTKMKQLAQENGLQIPEHILQTENELRMYQ